MAEENVIELKGVEKTFRDFWMRPVAEAVRGLDLEVARGDVSVFYIPATQMASDAGLTTLANMIIVGKVIRESGVCAWEGVEDALKKVVSARHADLLGANLKALEMGYNYEG